MAHQAQPLHALTGLRFVAAFAVFVHHVGGRFGLPKDELALGSFAVSFFFVLSGFILTYVYADRLQYGGLKKFYFTRWARIWPLHLACLLIAILTMGSMPHLIRGEGWGKLVTNALLLQSWVPNTPWVFSFNGVAWSISTESFFYMMFPLFLIGGQKKFWLKYVGLLGLTAIVLISLGSLSTIPEIQTKIDFYRIGHVNPLLRLPEFCTGMAVGFVHLNKSVSLGACFKNRNTLPLGRSDALAVGEGCETRPSTGLRRIWLDTVAELSCFAAMVGCWLMVNHYHLMQHISAASWGGETMGSWFRVTYSAGIFALTIFVFARSRGLVGRLMSSRMLVFLGEISFAFYMIHFVVIRYVDRVAVSFGQLSPWLVALCCLGISIAFSIMLFKLIEMPSKSMLLLAYDGNFKFGFKAFAESNWKFARSQMAALTAVVLVASVSMLVGSADNRPDDIAVMSIVDKTPAEFQHVSFGNQIELLGFETNPRPMGIELVMAWKKRATLTRRRFVHICSDSGQIVGYGRRNDQIFEDSRIGVVFLDSVFIRNEHLVQGATISVGFHSKEQGMAVVNKGPRSMDAKRLDLLSGQSFSSIVDSRLERVGSRQPGAARKQR